MYVLGGLALMFCTIVVCNRNCVYSRLYDSQVVVRICVREQVYLSKTGRCIDFSRKPKGASLR